MADGPETLDPNAAERVGRVLNDKWTLERLLGVGGMAAVYGARHRNGARAAVKILHADLADLPAVCERFLREGYAANRVEHRGAVRVLDDDIVRGGPDDGAAYLVMELLEGESLEDRIRRPPPLDQDECLTIANAVLEVLEAAHEHGVVHRDLKPDNIFLARDPDDGAMRVKVLDFGLARLVESASVTQSGLALGTPSYMSPEQAAGRAAEIDGRTDLFAVGVTLFRLLTGRRLNEDDNVLVLVMTRANHPVPPVRSIVPGIAEGVAAILDRALAFRREDRYATAAAMRADIQAVRESAASAASAASERMLETSEASAEASEPESLEETRPRLARRSMIPLVTVIFYVALLGAYLLTSPDPEPGAPGAMRDRDADADADADAGAARRGRAIVSGAGRDAQSPPRLPPSGHPASGASPAPRTPAQAPSHKPR